MTPEERIKELEGQLDEALALLHTVPVILIEGLTFLEEGVRKEIRMYNTNLVAHKILADAFKQRVADGKTKRKQAPASNAQATD